MPSMHSIISSHWAALTVVGLLLAVSLAAAWWWTREDEPSEGPRGRLRDLRWRVALVAVAVLVTATVYPLFVHSHLQWWWLAVPLTAAMVQALDIRIAAAVVPLWLISLGVYGLEVARHAGSSHSALTWYGVAQAGAGSATTYLVLPQAYAFLILGGWLAWRSLDARPRTARLVLGRMASTEPGPQRWGLLLLPAAVAAAALIGSGAWFAVMVALAAGALLVIRRSPVFAARVATIGIIAIGVAGLVLAKDWFTGSNPGAASGPASYSVSAGTLHHPAAAAESAEQIMLTRIVRNGFGSESVTCILPPGSSAKFVSVTACSAVFLPVRVASGPTSYVGVNVSSPSMASLAAAEALALVAFGCWLAPRTFPEVRRVLGLAPYAELTRRVQRRTESRALVADTAAADLRRLERNLHDGAQARLVALGMSLRAAEKLVHTSPDGAAALIAEARDTSARALTELRELFKGVHPPVLADRGLADAVRALALDSPLQVETEVDLPGRVPPPVETACYFAVSEVLTNAAKHSGAREARIGVSHEGGLLRIVITDFGLGGADPARGTGLAGVEKRLATFDGILAVSSPVGGPTTVVLEVPCALSSQKTSSY
jgi:signal transduction histidine kinase